MKNRLLNPQVLSSPSSPSVDRVLERAFWGGASPSLSSDSVGAAVVPLAQTKTRRTPARAGGASSTDL